MDKKQILKKLKGLKKEIKDLKESLNQINEQKETWFKKKEDLKKQISKLIKKIKEIKKKKDGSAELIQNLKKQRDEFNKEVKKLISEIKSINEKKGKILKEKKIKFNPEELNEQIEKLETKVETEALSFENEKKLMRRIKQLKKSLSESSGVENIFKLSKEISGKIDMSKEKAQEFHSKLQEEFKKSKVSYEDFMEISKQISKLKIEQEKAFKKFIDFKNKFLEVNEELKNKLVKAGKIQEKINAIDSNLKRKREKEKKQIFEKKTKEIEEKLKNKKKLTTEDLLIYRGSEE
jgi:uncharacterized coiled-coil DUF342 family protein